MLYPQTFSADDRRRNTSPPVSAGQLLEVSGVRRRVLERVSRSKTFGQPQWHKGVRVHHLPVQGQHAQGSQNSHPHALQQTDDSGSHGEPSQRVVFRALRFFNDIYNIILYIPTSSYLLKSLLAKFLFVVRRNKKKKKMTAAPYNMIAFYTKR